MCINFFDREILCGSHPFLPPFSPDSFAFRPHRIMNPGEKLAAV